MRVDSKDWPEFSCVLDRMLDVPPAEREGWVARLTGVDAFWAPELANLLRTAANSKVDAWFETLPKLANLGELEGGDLSARNLTAGQNAEEIGPYRLVRPLGRGGMGSVWYAERSDGLVRRGVALKLPIGLSGDTVLAARFARERDIVANLAHPHIARLYDAGIAANGQPYLALEYVEGQALDVYCDRHRLDVRARVRLFRQVLDAVQYAHGRLVIHRDLKPSNILVTMDGEVRLLDFGVAKLLDSEAAGFTELTRLGSPGMTLSYASPEQAAGQPVSTATDIYSLGVVLFELLVGTRPYRVKRDTRGALEEAVLRADVLLPSAVESGEAAAEARSTSQRKLRRDLHGDLDAILLKMLNRQPELRYATVAAAAQDLGRYCDGNTVEAHRPSRWYWLRKFVGRNRVAVASATLASAALLAGAAVAMWQAWEAQRQARLADAERDRALAAAEHRGAVDEFMSDLLLEAGRTGRPISVADLISRADSLSAQEFAGDPEARAAVLATVGRFAWEFDGIEKALSYFDQSQRILSTSRDDNLRAHVVCTRALLSGILGNAAEAQRVLGAIIGDSTMPSSARSECLGEQAKLAIVRYDGSTAARAADQAIEQWQASPRRSPAKLLELLAFRAEAQVLNGKPGDADRGFTYVMSELRRLGRDRSETSNMIRIDRRDAAISSGDLNQALMLIDEAIAESAAEVPDGPQSAFRLYDRSLILADLGRYSEALAGFETVAPLAALHDRLIQQRAELDAAAVLSKLGRAAEAEQRYRHAIEIAALAAPGQVPSSDIAAMLTRAKLDLDFGHFRAAHRNLTQVIRSPAIAGISLAAAHRMRALANLGDGDAAEGLADARTAVQLSEQQRGDKPFSAWAGEARLALGQVLQANGDLLGARANYARAIEQLVHTVGADHPALEQARELLTRMKP